MHYFKTTRQYMKHDSDKFDMLKQAKRGFVAIFTGLSTGD